MTRTVHKMVDVETYIRDSIGLFLSDVASNDTQRGFLAALLAIAHDVCLIPDDDPLIVAAMATLPSRYQDKIKAAAASEAKAEKAA